MTLHTSIAAGRAVPSAVIMTKLDSEDLAVPATPPHAEPQPMKTETTVAVKGILEPARSRGIMTRDAALLDRMSEDKAKSVMGDLYEPIMTDMKAAPKKVQEKIYNALSFIMGANKLSSFTDTAVEKLRVVTELSTKHLASIYMAEEYSEKTARSQAQQQMAVLPILRLATRDKDKLSLLPGPMLDALNAAATRPAPKRPEPEPAKIDESPAEPVAPVQEEFVLAPPTDEEIELAAIEEMLAAAPPSPALKKTKAAEKKAASAKKKPAKPTKKTVVEKKKASKRAK